MLLRDAVSKVRSGSVLPATVVLTGEEDYIRATGIRELIKAAGVTVPEMNVTTFEGAPPMHELIEALARFPFMSETKVVVLKETDILGTTASSALSKPLEKAVLEDHTLFVITTAGKLDKRKAYVKDLLSRALIVECNPLKDEALTKYIIGEAKRRRLHIGREAARELAERLQGDLCGINSELDKLASVVTGQITRDDIARLTPPSDELNMFGIFDTLAAGRHEQAYTDVKRLLAEDATPLGLVTFLANTFRQMLVARACRDAGFNERRTLDCVREETGAKEWTARRAYARSVQFPAERLRKNIQLLADVDFGVKQGEYILRNDLYGILQMLFRQA